MSQEVGSILVLAAVFAIGSLRPINMGLLGRGLAGARGGPRAARSRGADPLWGMSMIIIAPITAWAIFVLPGWL